MSTIRFGVVSLALMLSSTAHAQLHSAWTLTINGQPVQAEVDGSFTLSNIPSVDADGDGWSDQLFRVTGTAVVVGVPYYVQSDECFRVPRVGLKDLSDITLSYSLAPPVGIEALRASPVVPTLVAIGQQTQVEVRVDYSDGTEDLLLTPGEASCTTYRTSNAGIATVDGDGVVEAVGGGRALITVSNSGATSVTPVIVTLAPTTTVSHAVFVNCTFLENAAESGGALYNSRNSSPRATNCRFLSNAASCGGAVYNNNDQFGGTTMTPHYVNCTFSGNAAQFSGGAVFNRACDPRIVGCTLTGNHAMDTAGGVFSVGGSNNVTGSFPVIANSILHANSDSGGTGQAAQVLDDTAAPSAYSFVSYSLVQGLDSLSFQIGNIDGDPMFRDPDGADGIVGTVDDDVSLLDGSPAIDAGSNCEIPLDLDDLDHDGDTEEPVPVDSYGARRVADDLQTLDTGEGVKPVVDMGAGEYSADCNDNGLPDDEELGNCLGDPLCSDCNENGILDECDIDQCDPDLDPSCDDCNLNGIPDGCDIAQGNSNDTTPADGRPDECAQFVAGCPMDEAILWSCDDNWVLEDEINCAYPDINALCPIFHVVLDDDLIPAGAIADDVLLDVPSKINTLLMRAGAQLRVVGSGQECTATEPCNLEIVSNGTSALLRATMIVDADAEVMLSGASSEMLIDEGGQYGPAIGNVSALLNANTLHVRGGACPLQGRARFASSMLGMFENVILSSGSDPENPGCCEPDLNVVDNAVLVTNTFVIEGDSSILVSSSEPVVVSGAWQNASTAAELFDWIAGAIKCDGQRQSYEVAGTDIGPLPTGYDDNFAIGTIDISASSEVTLQDSIDNDLQGQGPCTEALYVKTLTLRSGATITLDNVRLYYLELIDEGATVNTLGCASLVQVPGANGVPDCADLDESGIRDDECLWWSADEDGACDSTAVVFADVGGPFGACSPDEFANIHDRNHTLACFAGTSSCDAMNIDAGGPFGDCPPDGFCNIHDANHTLAAFAGTTSCTCDDISFPQPGFSPPDLGGTSVTLVPRRRLVRPAETIEVDVYVQGPITDLRSYQLHVSVSGGRRGQLRLVGMSIDVRRDYVFQDRADQFAAFNLAAGQMLAGLGADIGEPVKDRGYLVTVEFEASRHTEGSFVIDLAHGIDAQTFLVASMDREIGIRRSKPAVVSIGAAPSRLRSKKQGP